MPDIQFTSDEDLAAGWTDSDWTANTKKTGEDKLGEPGGTEAWRFQLDRRLTPAERNKVALRDDEYYDPETQGFDINRLLTVIRDVAPNVKVVRARIGGQEARAVVDWHPVYEERTGRRIVDPDGFREDGFTAHTLLTWEEFNRRAGVCTTALVNRR